MLKPFWISWWQDPNVEHELHTPWWYSGERGREDDESQSSICAAVMALDEDHARRIINDSHDTTVELEWRFVEGQPEGWSPFNDRFRREEWMRWPDA